MADGNAAGQIVLKLLSDSSPQFDRQFTLSLTDVEGGADINQNFDTSTFIIKLVFNVLVCKLSLHTCV